MNKIAHDMIAWVAAMAIGITIGASLNNMALGIGAGVSISAGLSSIWTKKEKNSNEKKSSPKLVTFFWT